MRAQINFDTLMAALSALELEAQSEILEALETFLRGPRDERSRNIVSRPSLARHLLYLGQSLGDNERDGTSRGSAPQWGAMLTRYKEMVATDKVGRLLPAITRDDLRNFCGLKHLRQGSREDLFYSALLIFTIYEDKQGSFEHPYFKDLVPQGERDLPIVAAELLGHFINETQERLDLEPSFPQIHSFPRSRDNPQVIPAFSYDAAEREKLDRFYNRFASSADLHAHLILYRPRRSKPTQLIRSFLALSAPWNDRLTGSRGVHNYVHIYRAPSDVGHEGRVGQGWALPLSQGLYLVGGQRPESVLWDPGVDDEESGAVRPPRIPFRSLDVLYFPWQALESNLPHGLMMTANKDGVPIVTRVCALPTLVAHSKHVDIGEVALEALAESLEQEWQRERDLAERAGLPAEAPTLAVYEQFGDTKLLAARIGDLCNNDPHSWEVPNGYRAKKRRGGALTHAQVEHSINQAFGVGEDVKYASPDRDFDFWRSLRFPPLSSD
jgi:hypothetical protein